MASIHNKLAKLCFDKAQYAADKINKIKGFSLYFNRRDFIKEFTVKTKFLADRIKQDAEKNNILFDVVDKNLIKFSFTEKRSKKDIDRLVNFLDSYHE